MAVKKTLDEVRTEIDRIDDAIHDLVMRRTEIVEQVRDLKEGEDVKIRPAREARIIYRLLDRHKGHFPRRELVRIWRELIVATLSFEGPFSVAVYSPEHIAGYWQLARNQYGSFTKMAGHASVRRVIEAVRSGEATVGILPFPFQGEPDPWWRHLVSIADDAPRVIARLPFATPRNTRVREIEAVAIAKVEQQSSGRDRSFIAIDGGRLVGMQQAVAACKAKGLPSVAVHEWHDEHRPEIWFTMVEVDDFVAPNDPRLTALAQSFDDDALRVVPLGGYAKPLSADELIFDQE